MPTLAFAPVKRAIPGVRLGSARISPTRVVRRGSRGTSVCPSYALGVVVFVNSRQNLIETGKLDADAARILDNIISAIARERLR